MSEPDPLLDRLLAWEPEWSMEAPPPWTRLTDEGPPIFEHERLEHPEQLLAFYEEDVTHRVG